MRAAPALRGGLVARLAWLVAGLFLCACGIVAFLESRLGLSPWDVLHQGIAKHTPLSFGLANVVDSLPAQIPSLRSGILSRAGLSHAAPPFGLANVDDSHPAHQINPNDIAS